VHRASVTESAASVENDTMPNDAAGPDLNIAFDDRAGPNRSASPNPGARLDNRELTDVDTPSYPGASSDHRGGPPMGGSGHTTAGI
jgi:hypothetical protein